MGNVWNLQQTIAANNGAAAAATVAGTLAATQNGSLLIAVVMVGINGASITPPAGWKLATPLQSTNPAGGTLGIYYYQGNPGNITNVSFTITSALASVILQEWTGGYLLDTPSLIDVATTTRNANGAAWGLSGFTPEGYGELCICGVAYINAAAITVTAYPTGFTENGNTIGTAGAGNAGIRLASMSGNSVINLGVGGLGLSATPTDGPISFGLIFEFQPIYNANNMIGPANESIGGVI